MGGSLSCPISSRPRLRPTRRAFSVLFLAAALWHQALALVEPHLDPDLSVGRVRFREAVVDVGAQRLQRQLPVQVPLRPRDFGAVQTARDTHLDPAGAEPQRRFHRLAHRPAERHALLELHRHRLGDQLRIELGLLNLLNVDEHFAAGLLLDFLLQLVDLGPLPADDDAGPGRVDVDLEPVDGALGLDLRDAGVREPLLQRRAQREILVQQLRVIAVRVPARAPRLVEAEAESKRVNFLTHSYSFAFVTVFLRPASDFLLPPSGFLPCGRRGRFSAASVATATTFSGRSDTCTVRCAVRFRTRNARPIGAGRTRLADGPWLA